MNPLLRLLRQLLATLLAWVLLPLLFLWSLGCRLRRKVTQPRLLWGPCPIISYKYWSVAMAKAGFQSRTLMFGYYASINKRKDYDAYCSDWFDGLPKPLARAANFFLAPYAGFLRAVWGYEIHHLCFSGGYLGATSLWRYEAPLLALAGVKTVLMPYGADAYMYSRIVDPCLRHVLNISYPTMARREGEVQRRVFYWSKWADAIIANFMSTDGMPRNDVGIFSNVTIDTELWQPCETYSSADGRKGMVNVIHTPNHRGFKGSEFLIKAVEELQAEGLQVKLILLERLQNDEVRRIMREEADILAEQFIATAYAMSGIEGMATGLPVIANLDHPAYTQPFRRYSFLNECPILSTTPESLKEHLRMLITRPELREALGKAGRVFVTKYHSERTAQFLFSKVYDRIWFGREVDLINLFHPLLGEYACDQPKTDHPLVENRLPC